MAKFEYKKRDVSAVEKRMTQSSGLRDNFLKDGIKAFTPKEGDNIVRFLPPTWEGAAHYGYDVWVHYNVGADEASYMCLQKMYKTPCPICEERRRLESTNSTSLKEKEYIKKLMPKQRIASWIINRDFEKDGVKLWLMPASLDKDVSIISFDKKTREVIEVDHPEIGYDIEFVRKGTKLNTEYLGVKIDRKSSPLGDEKWLDHAIAHPVPTCFASYDYAHIKSVFEGCFPIKTDVGATTKKAVAEESPTKVEEVEKDDMPSFEEQNKASMKESVKEAVAEETTPELTYDSIVSLNKEELLEMATELGVSLPNTLTDVQLLTTICSKLKVEMPVVEEKKAIPSWKDKLKKIKEATA